MYVIYKSFFKLKIHLNFTHLSSEENEGLGSGYSKVLRKKGIQYLHVFGIKALMGFSKSTTPVATLKRLKKANTLIVIFNSL